MTTHVFDKSICSTTICRLRLMAYSAFLESEYPVRVICPYNVSICPKHANLFWWVSNLQCIRSCVQPTCWVFALQSLLMLSTWVSIELAIITRCNLFIVRSQINILNKNWNLVICGNASTYINKHTYITLLIYVCACVCEWVCAWACACALFGAFHFLYYIIIVVTQNLSMSIAINIVELYVYISAIYVPIRFTKYYVWRSGQVIN